VTRVAKILGRVMGSNFTEGGKRERSKSLKGLINKTSLRGLSTEVEQYSIQESRPLKWPVHEDSYPDLRLRALSAVSHQSEVLANKDISNFLSLLSCSLKEFWPFEGLLLEEKKQLTLVYVNYIFFRIFPKFTFLVWLLIPNYCSCKGLFLYLTTFNDKHTHTHTHTHTHSVGLPWTSDQPVAETSTWQHTTLTRDRNPCPRLDSNPQSQEASGCRHRF